jgi:hypothetical protein
VLIVRVGGRLHERACDVQAAKPDTERHVPAVPSHEREAHAVLRRHRTAASIENTDRSDGDRRDANDPELDRNSTKARIMAPGPMEVCVAEGLMGSARRLVLLHPHVDEREIGSQFGTQ